MSDSPAADNPLEACRYLGGSVEAQPSAAPRTPLRAVAPVGLVLIALTPLIAWVAARVTDPAGTPPVSVPWWAIALVFAGGHSVALNIQTAREARSVSVTELPFVVGLLLLSPIAFCSARLLGCVL